MAFIGYAIVFLFRNFTGDGFELGVQTLNGVTRDNLNALNPAIMHYIGHLHVATAGFIAATGIAVAAVSWWGVRRGEWWAWIAAVISRWPGGGAALPLQRDLPAQLGHAPWSNPRRDPRVRSGRPAGAARDDTTGLTPKESGIGHKSWPLFDHLIRPLQERRWDHEAEGLGRLEVDDQLEHYRLLDRQLRRDRALEDAVDEAGHAPVEGAITSPVRHEPALLDGLTPLVDRGQAQRAGRRGDHQRSRQGRFVAPSLVSPRGGV